MCGAKSRPTCFHRMDHRHRPNVHRSMGDASKRSQMLREQAERCRRLARATTDANVSRKLLELAAEFEEQANAEQSRSRAADNELRTKPNSGVSCLSRDYAKKPAN